MTIDMFGNAFFQKGEFKCDDNITVLQNGVFSDEIYLFLTSRLNVLSCKYSYGKQLRVNRLARDKIMLPAYKDGHPNWHFMQEYIRERKNKQRQELKGYYEKRLLDLFLCPEMLTDVEWGEFFIGGVDGVFEVRGTITTHPSKLNKNGLIPRITCAATNNGLEGFYDNLPTEKGGVLTVDSATIGYVSYQGSDFIATDHVEKIRGKDNRRINKEVGLFLKTSIENRSDSKYGYGYKFSQTRIKRQKIMLPIDKNGDSNWSYMENFVKNIEQKQVDNVLKYFEERM
ncbi:restriction endonuclease subunit S [Canibacter zhuwentaonis]|uniref:restriction endonuclease subunit S n=1 Tax=Canibacter zhuwentaonis TaxID=2837491 RepID=UPI0032B37D36